MRRPALYRVSSIALSRQTASWFPDGERFAKMVERRRFLVFGAADGELRAILDPLGAIYFDRLDGFSAIPIPSSWNAMSGRTIR